MRPDFSFQMLRLFVSARVQFCAISEGLSEQSAQTKVHRELIDISGLTQNRLWAAMSGMKNQEKNRARLWAALGHVPALEQSDDNVSRETIDRADNKERMNACQ